MKKKLSMILLVGSLTSQCFATDLNCESQQFLSDNTLENIKNLTPNT